MKEETIIKFLKSDYKRAFERFSEALLNIIYPEDVKCIFCNEELMGFNDYPFCKHHKEQFQFIMGYTCIRCGRQINSEEHSHQKRCKYCIGEPMYYKNAITMTYYEGPIKHLLYKLKYGHQTYVTKFIARMMYEKIESDEYDYIIPVPIHKKREIKRGFNQSYLIAKHLSKLSVIQVEKDIISKTQNTPYLSKLSKEERKEILKQAFKITRTSKIKNKRLLLIDDIFTTGATVNAISKELSKLEPKSITVITFAVGDYTK